MKWLKKYQIRSFVNQLILYWLSQKTNLNYQSQSC